MRIRWAGLAAAMTLLAAVPTLAGAASKGQPGPPRDTATGGGQALFGESPNGAGDTVAFVAHRSKAATESNPSLATGQVQVNRRSTNEEAGTGPVKFHGVVDCLVVNGGRSVGDAYISGHKRGDPSQRFELRVTDGGRGQAERGSDMIALFAPGETDQGDEGQEDDAEGPCGFAEEPGTVGLFRGNVQTWNADKSDDQTAPAPADDAQTAAALTTANSLIP